MDKTDATTKDVQLTINADLLTRAKGLATLQGVTLASVIQAALTTTPKREMPKLDNRAMRRVPLTVEARKALDGLAIAHRTTHSAAFDEALAWYMRDKIPQSASPSSSVGSDIRVNFSKVPDKD